MDQPTGSSVGKADIVNSQSLLLDEVQPSALEFNTRVEAEIEPDSGIDDVSNETDSAFGDNEYVDLSYTNGYHSFDPEKYWAPNDELENDRLDLCAHMFGILLKGELHLAPIPSDPQRILDIGTGTGIWAIDMADKFPSAHVIGNDLSPVQPNFFEVDDIEQPWPFSAPFDYIHSSYLCGCVRDWPKLISQAYNFTREGGWIEFMDFTMGFETIHGEYKAGCAVSKWTDVLCAALYEMGLEPAPGPKLEGWIRDAGFINVHVVKFQLPVGLWPKERRMKEVGAANLIQFLANLEGFSFRLFQAQGWEIEEITVLLAQVRREFKNPRFQMQHPGYVVYAQRPITSSSASQQP